MCEPDNPDLRYKVDGISIDNSHMEVKLVNATGRPDLKMTITAYNASRDESKFLRYSWTYLNDTLPNGQKRRVPYQVPQNITKTTDQVQCMVSRCNFSDDWNWRISVHDYNSNLFHLKMPTIGFQPAFEITNIYFDEYMNGMDGSIDTNLDGH